MKLIGLNGKEYMHAPINHIEDTYATCPSIQAKNINQTPNGTLKQLTVGQGRKNDI